MCLRHSSTRFFPRALRARACVTTAVQCAQASEYSDAPESLTALHHANPAPPNATIARYRRTTSVRQTRALRTVVSLTRTHQA